jgi:hypothetical protein
MIFYKPQSLFDEFYWNSDSFTRSGLYKISSSATSYGILSSSFDVDYYEITPGLGNFKLIVTSEGMNASTFYSSSFDIKVTDNLGNVLLSADSVGPDIYSDAITFSSSSNQSYYVEVRNSGFSSLAYGATIDTAEPVWSSPFSGLKASYTEGEKIQFSYTTAGTPGTSGTFYFFISGITQADTSTTLSGTSSNLYIQKNIFYSSITGLGAASVEISLTDDGISEGVEYLTISTRDGASSTVQILDPVDTTPPIINSFSPTINATGVATNSNIVLTFSEIIQRGTGSIQMREGSSSGTVVETFDVATSNRVGISSKSVTFDPQIVLLAGKSYFLTIPSGAFKDEAGNSYVGTQSYSFTTASVNSMPTGMVTISGTPTQGQTLNATNSLADADGLGTITYTWKASGATIGTGTTYTLKQAEVGKTITVTASYTDGSNTAESVTSAATPSVANVNDAPTGSVTIAGTAALGQTLTVSNTLADLDGLGAITYIWKAGSKTVGTGTTYQISDSVIGESLVVIASYVDGEGSTEQVASSSTNIIFDPTPTLTIYPVEPEVNEGSNAIFNIETSNFPSGTRFSYNLLHLSKGDVSNGELTGSINIGPDGKARVTIPIANDQLTEGDELLSLEIEGRASGISIKDTSKNPQPIWNLSSQFSRVHEGGSAIFDISTTNVPPGTVFEYTISGVSESDIKGSRIGEGKVDQNGFARIIVPITADQTNEPSETLLFSIGELSKSVEIIDKRVTIELVAERYNYQTKAQEQARDSILEGEYISINLSRFDLPAGAYGYVVTGGSLDSDYTLYGRPNQGSVYLKPISEYKTIEGNQATPIVINLFTIEDKLTESIETLSIYIVSNTNNPSASLANPNEILEVIHLNITDNSRDQPTPVSNYFTTITSQIGGTASIGQEVSLVGSRFATRYTLTGVKSGKVNIDFLAGTDYSWITDKAYRITVQEIIGQEAFGPALLDSYVSKSSQFFFDAPRSGSYAVTFRLDSTNSWGSQQHYIISTNQATPEIKINNIGTSINEGDSATFHISTSPLHRGTPLSYEISGISDSDLENGNLTGTAIIGPDGTTYIQLPIAADQKSEGDEIIRIDIAGQNSKIIIKDISKDPDNIPPTLKFHVEPDVTEQSAGRFKINFILSENSTDFDYNDINLTGATLINFGGSATNYTASILLNSEIEAAELKIMPGKFTDPSGNFNASTYSLNLKVPDINILVHSRYWADNRPLEGASILAENKSGLTSSAGLFDFSSPSGSKPSIFASLDTKDHDAPGISSAIGLNDAIQILKMISGQAGIAASPNAARAQSLAADFDGSGAVGLADALGVLRHAVGLQAPAPSWVFIEEGDNTAHSVLNPGIPGPVTVDVTPPGPIEVNLIGVLRGDVDGSYGVYGS